MQKQSLNCRISAEWPRLSVFVFDSVSGSVILQYRPLVVHLEEFANQLKNIFENYLKASATHSLRIKYINPITAGGNQPHNVNLIALQ